jgi:hypothetical protein
VEADGATAMAGCVDALRLLDGGSLHRQILESRRLHVRDSNTARHDRACILIGARFDNVVVGNFLLLIDDWTARSAITEDDVRDLVGNDEGKPSGLVLIVTEDDDGAAFYVGH